MGKNKVPSRFSIRNKTSIPVSVSISAEKRNVDRPRPLLVASQTTVEATIAKQNGSALTLVAGTDDEKTLSGQHIKLAETIVCVLPSKMLRRIGCRRVDVNVKGGKDVQAFVSVRPFPEFLTPR